ncbi:succinate/fumarate mitochondrial transporter [Ramicandelaber brevisporus]|nr:succinate/fumarate mitochondrial transporter [Ramicandelaber brevisporus]
MSKAGGDGKKKVPQSIHLVGGACAGFMEAMICHPLDTIKVRMQLRKNRPGAPDVPKPNFIRTGYNIVTKESFAALYKGLGAVTVGIVPKMAIRFLSFEYYKDFLADKETGKVSPIGNFIAGLGAGTTEAVLVVTPMDVIKIRLQAQRHSLADPMDVPKYRNAAHAAFTIVKEEGISVLYRGVALTALRQATNQAANFTVYKELVARANDLQPERNGRLPVWQTMIIGGISGAMGPLFNAPIDTIKTRIQKNPNPEGYSGWKRFQVVVADMYKKEGPKSFYKGLTPRVLRVAPGQSVTFVVYEFVTNWIMTVGAKRNGNGDSN